jgi:hypothetical protein
MQPFTSSINNTSSFRLPGDTMRQGGIDSQPIFFQTIQVPNTGSLIHFGAASAATNYLFQYDLDTNFDVTTLNTASRVYEELRQLTASGNYLLQTSYNNDGSQMYQIQQNFEGNISPFNHWTILHVIDLSIPYDLDSYNSSNTSSYILENELSNLSGPYPSDDGNFVEVSTLNEFNINNLTWTSSMYYTNYVDDTVVKFRINSDRSLSNIESLTVNDFPMQIRYTAPTSYQDTNDLEYKSFFVSNSLGPYDESVNINRTSSCLAPYSVTSGNLPTTSTNIVLSNGGVADDRCNGTIIINYNIRHYWIETDETHPYFAIGDTIYIDNSLSQTFNGQDLWYIIGSLETMSHVVVRRKISTTGVITEEFACS